MSVIVSILLKFYKLESHKTEAFTTKSEKQSWFNLFNLVCPSPILALLLVLKNVVVSTAFQFPELLAIVTE